MARSVFVDTCNGAPAVAVVYGSGSAVSVVETLNGTYNIEFPLRSFQTGAPFEPLIIHEVDTLAGAIVFATLYADRKVN